MGERKGQNFYYPPDFDPKKHGSLNGYHGVHALRERARKLDKGILIIRFEMPYNIWCDGCKKHIGMGVRYNAEKTKIGMYYTTPVYQFRFKCHLCPNKITIKTDPGNMDYVITEGARRVEQRWDPSQNGQIVPDDKSIGRKLADDAMYKLEHEKTDKDKSSDAAPRINQLSNIQDRVKDDWLANRILRDQFRAKKKERKAQLEKDKLITGKCGLEMDLVAEEDEDVKMARLLNVQSKTDADQKRDESRGDISNADIFANTNDSQDKDSKADKKLHALKTIGKATKSKQSDLLLKKGFGLVVSKVKANLKDGKTLKDSESLKNIAEISSPITKISSSSNLPQTTSSSSLEVPEKSMNIIPTSPSKHDSNTSGTNSLSMLFSQYDDSSGDESS